MKKRFLSLLTALCLMLTLAPAAFAADSSGLQDLIDADTTGTITLTQDYTLSDTVTINKAITINGDGHTITYNGSGSAMTITATAAVKLQDLNINATNSSAYAVNLTSSQPDFTLDGCTINEGNRGINMYPSGGCTGGKLTVNNSTIKNSRVTGDYSTNTSTGDTRGIALYEVKNSDIEINDSHIYGFGYSVNMSGNQIADGTRPAGNRFYVTDTEIWGWSAFNIWTVGNTYNFVNCDMRGLNPMNTVGNSFSVIVLSEGIYGSTPSQVTPNVFNITGGSYTAICTSGSENVEETLFCIDDDYCSKFNFYRYENEETLESEYVTLYCDRPFAAFMACYYGMTDSATATWAASHVTGNQNTVYNWGLLAPGMSSDPWPANTLSEENTIQTMLQASHTGGWAE